MNTEAALVGWVGIVLFSLQLLGIVFVTDDYIFNGSNGYGPNVPPALGTLWRLLLLGTNAALLILCFKRLEKSRRAENAKSV
jgi:hypothetical protein